MHKILLVFILSAPGFAQQTINLPTLTISADGVVGIQQFLISNLNGPYGFPPVSPTTLAGNVSAAALTLTVVDGTKIKTTDTIKIDNECMPVASIAGNVVTLTARADLGTTAAAHTSGAPVNTLLYPSIKNFFKMAILSAVANALDNSTPPSIVTQLNNIKNAQNAISTIKTAAVQ